MRILTAWFKDGSAFMETYNETIGAGAMYYATVADLRIGEPVLMEIYFPQLPNRMLVRGKVVSIDLQQNGAWISFVSEDADTQEFIVGVARGDITIQTKVHRKHTRYPIEIPVDWKVGDSDDLFISCTEDVSAGGAFIRTLAPPAIGTRVALVLTPQPDQVLTIAGRVTWTRHEPGQEGMGLRFEQPSSETARALREALRKMDENAAIGTSAARKAAW